MILFSHPTGNANVRHAALGLERAGLLSEFWTTVHHDPASSLHRLLPSGLAAQLSRRSYPPELHPFIHSSPVRELLRMGLSRLGINKLTRHETGLCSVDAVYRALDLKVAKRLRRQPFKAIYAYEDGAFHSFAAAKEKSVPCIYDLPIGYWRAAREIMSEEASRNPEWAMTIPGNADSEAKTQRKDQELAQADLILVASTFTKSTLASAANIKAPIHVIPYGAPDLPVGIPPRVYRRTGKLKALYIGSLGQRKGLSYLFEACRAVSKEVDLTVVGRLPELPCPALNAELTKVRWIPSCPHQEILRLMGEHDVFVFPSLFEGFGLVLLEAMALGLPLITTANTAGPDLLGDKGKEGFIVPIQNAGAIAEKLSLLANNRELLEEMSQAAIMRAKQFTWRSYEDALAIVLKNALA